MRMKGKHVVLAFVFLVLGFMISYSYQFTKLKLINNMTNRQWEAEYQYRQMLINQEQRNRELQKELFEKQEKVRSLEEEFAKQEKISFNLVEDVERLRMYTGKIAVKGKGVEITLADASYIPTEENANNYIVHESHVFKVVNDLFISGAAAVAINGQRLSKNSYISCNGPVITIDGNQFPAPFVVTAIGDADVLYSALNIAGGVKDQLVEDNIVVRIAKKDDVLLKPLIHPEENS